MNAQDFVGLLPIIAVASVSVVLMLAISFQRNYDLAWQIAIAGLGLSMVAVLIAWNVVPLQITPLILVDQYALFFSFLLLAFMVIAMVWMGLYPQSMLDISSPALLENMHHISQ